MDLNNYKLPAADMREKFASMKKRNYILFFVLISLILAVLIGDHLVKSQIYQISFWDSVKDISGSLSAADLKKVDPLYSQFRYVLFFLIAVCTIAVVFFSYFLWACPNCFSKLPHQKDYSLIYIILNLRTVWSEFKIHKCPKCGALLED